MALGRCVFFASNPMFMLLTETSRVSTGKVTKLKQIRTIHAPPLRRFYYAEELQGYLAYKKQPPPLGPPCDPGKVLLYVSRRGVFLVSEVPL